jgi:hypothetical protein
MGSSGARLPTPRIQLTLIVTVALVLRLAVVAATAHTHSAEWFFGQATELGRLAESLRTGHGLSSPFGGSTGPSAFLSPGYPAIVAAVFAIFGPYSFASAIAIMCLQAVFGAATVMVLMLLVRRAFGVTVATVAGLIGALALPALFLPTLFWETSLSVLLATTLFALAMRCALDSRTGDWIALGITGAAALSVNPSLLPILICCFGWAIYRTRSRPRFAPITSVALCLVLSTPWVIRNAYQLHTFIPFRSNVGYELWQGNRPGSDGFFLAELHPNVNRAEFLRYALLGEVGYMHEKSVIAREYIAANPGWFLEFTMKRILYFWTGIVRQSATLVVAYISLTSLLGFTGLAMLWRRNRPLAIYFLLPIMLFPVPYYITHPDFRFRLVIDPVLAVLSAYVLTYRQRTADGDADRS